MRFPSISDPISAEEKASAEGLIEGDVYWTAFGKKYHIDEDCQALANSDTLYAGSVTDAIEANRTTLCAFAPGTTKLRAN